MSIKDRDQKEAALQFCLSRDWFPQVEVDLFPVRQVSRRASAQTDIDVFALIPASFGGYSRHVIDCKTKAKESPINRVFWMHGLMKQLGANTGTCILKKETIEVDHRLTAFDLGISLVEESEFSDWSVGLGGAATNSSGFFSHAEKFEYWEDLLAADRRNQKLSAAVLFLRSGFWQIKDEAEAARKCIFLLKSIRGEIDPSKPEQVALAVYLSALFATAAAGLAHRLFSLFVLPKEQAVYEEALRVSLYGGRDTYEQRNSLYKLLVQARGHEDPEALGVPGWDYFSKMIRQMMESPIEATYGAHILQETSFAMLKLHQEISSPRAIRISTVRRRSAQFALSVSSYLFKATKLPSEIEATTSNLLLNLISSTVAKTQTNA
jgi:hypothetical protein